MLIEVAELVRWEIEAFVLNRDCSISYKDLCGACGIGSWVLNRVYRRLGVNSHFVMGRYDKNSHFHDTYYGNHCWLEIDKHIVDVTATQFGVPDRVFVTGFDNPCYRAEYYDRAAFCRLSRWGDQSQSSWRHELQEIVNRVYCQSKSKFSYNPVTTLQRYDRSELLQATG